MLKMCANCDEYFETDNGRKKLCPACTMISRGQLPSHKPRIKGLSKPKYSIKKVSREATKRGISYGKMVLLIEKGEKI